MKRYWQVLNLFWTTAIAAELEYRLNFLIATLSSLGNMVGSLFSLFLFYRHNYQFQGWSWEEAMVIMGVFTLLQGCWAIFLVPNLNRIVNHVQEGTLDFILLKPISTQFWLSTRAISPWGIPDLLFGVILITYAGQKLHLGWEQYLASLMPLFFAVVILYSIWFMLATTSIWFVKINNVTEVLRSLLQAGRFPLVAYPAAYRFFFTFVIPVAFLTTVPAQAMLNRSQTIWIIGSGILAFWLLWASKLFWQFALRFYTSASS